MPVPNTFANATATIPLSQLDANFATTITLGNTAIQLGNTVSTLNNMTLANVTVTSGNVTITNVTVTTANVTNLITGNAAITGGAINGTTLGATTASTANVTTLTTSSTVTINGGTATQVQYLDGSKALVGSANLTFNGTTLSAAGLSDSGNLTFTGTGNRILGDFSNATVANRVAFQTSTANSATAVSAIPNGTATQSQWEVFNASDPTNAARGQFLLNASELSVRSQIAGTGTYLPMTFYTGGSERMRIDTSGNVGIGTSSPTTILNAYHATSAIISVDGDSTTQFRASRYSSDTSPSQVITRKARGTLASPSAVNSGDSAGALGFQVFGGTNFRNAAQVLGLCETYTSDTNVSGALAFSTNAGGTTLTERMRIDASGNVLVTSAGGGLGYGTGSGGTVTQATSKSTAVTLNKPTGRITMNTATLNANTTVSFTCNNSLVTVNDTVILTMDATSPSAQSAYNIWAYVGAGSISINVRNISGTNYSDGLVINFAVIKGATS